MLTQPDNDCNCFIIATPPVSKGIMFWYEMYVCLSLSQTDVATALPPFTSHELKAVNAAVMLLPFHFTTMTKINIKPCYPLIENNEASCDNLIDKLSVTLVSVSETS